MATATRLSVKQGRKFGLTLGIAFLVLGSLSFWRGHVYPPIVLVALGFVLVAAGLVVPTYLGPIERRWMAFGHWLSQYTSPIILGFIYFGVLTPTGAIRRLLGKNPLTSHHREETSWVSRDSKRKSDLKRQY